MADFIAVVPARWASSRLPGKALADIGGRPMIARTLQRAAQSGAARVIAATDDERIAACARAFGFEAVITGECDCGSARAAEAARILAFADDAIVVNVQGDEPLIAPALIGKVANALAANEQAVCASAARPLRDAAAYHSPAVVKVAVDRDAMAKWFSRAPLPMPRDAVSAPPPGTLAHIGIYAYRAAFLRRFPHLAPGPFESAEKLEQLRILWHGYQIALVIDEESEEGIGVDTPADLARARAAIAAAE
jgi:3-deoxy-manno-octulosonate cytidylyltransferase (CMP-KDO synthetase)